MAYLRETQGSADTIRFYYAKDDIFNQVSLRTLYRAKMIKDPNGEILIDEFGVSESERDAFNIHLDTASTIIFGMLLKLTKPAGDLVADDDINWLEEDKGSTTTSTTSDDYVYIRVIDNDAFPESILKYVDETMFKLFILYVMVEWYSMCGLDQEMQKIQAQYNQFKKDLMEKGLFQLRKVLV